MRKIGIRIYFCFLISFVILVLSCGPNPAPVSVILCIGDGMGTEQQRAASYYLTGSDASLSFSNFPVKGFVSTNSADSSITDSAASATAMATGVKVNNGVISRRLPGNGEDLETLLEYAKARGKSTGIVTTTAVTHATPAAFTAHNESRSNYSGIALDLFTVTKPNVILGGGGSVYGVDLEAVTAYGYNLVTTGSDLLNTADDSFLCGIFNNDHLPYEFDGYTTQPHLHEMAGTALKILDTDPDGFFLMIEGGRIDHAAHGNDLERMVYEVAEFSNTAQTVMDWMAGREDVLLIVTSDHETGGLSVISNNGQGNMPGVTWSTTGHTGADVPFYVDGYGREVFLDLDDNTGFLDRIIKNAW